MEKVEWQVVFQVNYIEFCYECGWVGFGYMRDCFYCDYDDIVNFERQEQEGEQYCFQRDLLEGKWDWSKVRFLYLLVEEDVLFMDLFSGLRGQQVQF